MGWDGVSWDLCSGDLGSGSGRGAGWQAGADGLLGWAG